MVKIKMITLMLVALMGTTVSADSKESLILGGRYLRQYEEKHDKRTDNFDQYNTIERFFRPSSMPVLNDKIESSLYDMYGSKALDLKIPSGLLKTPEDMIINYFSILREAANPTDENETGCGSLGDTRGPYPVAYNFLSSSYKKNNSYKEYLKSFENKLHTNLIKLKEVPRDEKNLEDRKYFVELEIIEGTNENKGVFGYYYGYIYVTEEDGVYKIKDMQYAPENYLCAPYHGWNYDAESIVEIKYKEWCSLVDSDMQVKTDGYEKKVYFKDKNKNEYYVLFYQLTNGYDIKIADYKKNKDGKWEVIYLKPEKCLENKR
ncbi:MAG: hypothetical protein RR942_03725 [Romboutsia sp.]